MVWRLVLALLVLAVSVGLAAWSLMIAVIGMPEMGVVAEEPGGHVIDVLAGGPSWRDGVRADQLVLRVERSTSDPLSWEMETVGPIGPIVSSASAAAADLRSTVPLAVLALAASAIGAIGSRRDRRLGLAVAAIATLGAAVPLWVSGAGIGSTVGPLLALTTLVAALLTLGRPSWPVAATLILAAVALAGGWLVARFVVPAAFTPASTAMICGLSLGCFAIVRSVLPSDSPRRVFDRIGPVGRLDLVVVAIAIPAIAAVIVLTDTSWMAGVLLAAVAVLAYPRARRIVARGADDLFRAGDRERAAVAALEDERRRLAQDIHDSPLQEITAVIRRLEEHPDVGTEADALRQVADHLRSVATELHAPVLQDLGLGAALDFLADQRRRDLPDCVIRVSVDDRTDPLAGARAPDEVELAGFRIVQEALENAVRHAHPATIEVRGAIAPDSVVIEVMDDGVGFSSAQAAAALAEGHLGLVTMHRRAMAVGGDLTINRGLLGGTSVQFTWLPG